jgi:hypothetical protein
MSANITRGRSSRLPVVLILLLMAIPLLVGGYRLVTLAIGTDIFSADPKVPEVADPARLSSADIVRYLREA